MRPEIQRIAGKTVDLVNVAPEFFEVMVAWRNNPENRRFFFSQTPWTVEGQVRWYARYSADATDATFVIVLKRGEPIGTVAIYGIDEALGTAEFGRMLIGDRRFRGQGFAREAAELALDAAFRLWRLEQVCLEVMDGNAAAIALYEKLGFVFDRWGLRVGEDGAEQKARRMVLEKDTWQARRAAGTLLTLPKG